MASLWVGSSASTSRSTSTSAGSPLLTDGWVARKRARAMRTALRSAGSKSALGGHPGDPLDAVAIAQPRVEGDQRLPEAAVGRARAPTAARTPWRPRPDRRRPPAPGGPAPGTGAARGPDRRRRAPLPGRPPRRRCRRPSGGPRPAPAAPTPAPCGRRRSRGPAPPPGAAAPRPGSARAGPAPAPRPRAPRRSVALGSAALRSRKSSSMRSSFEARATFSYSGSTRGSSLSGTLADRTSEKARSTSPDSSRALASGGQALLPAVVGGHLRLGQAEQRLDAQRHRARPACPAGCRLRSALPRSASDRRSCARRTIAVGGVHRRRAALGPHLGRPPHRSAARAGSCRSSSGDLAGLGQQRRVQGRVLGPPPLARPAPPARVHQRGPGRPPSCAAPRLAGPPGARPGGSPAPRAPSPAPPAATPGPRPPGPRWPPARRARPGWPPAAPARRPTPAGGPAPCAARPGRPRARRASVRRRASSGLAMASADGRVQQVLGLVLLPAATAPCLRRRSRASGGGQRRRLAAAPEQQHQGAVGALGPIDARRSARPPRPAPPARRRCPCPCPPPAPGAPAPPRACSRPGPPWPAGGAAPPAPSNGAGRCP